jgi:hypothetical protein
LQESPVSRWWGGTAAGVTPVIRDAERLSGCPPAIGRLTTDHGPRDPARGAGWSHDRLRKRPGIGRGAPSARALTRLCSEPSGQRSEDREGRSVQRLRGRLPTPSTARAFTSFPALTNSQDVACRCEVASPYLRLRQERAESPAGAHASSEPRRRDHGSRCRRRCGSEDDALDGRTTFSARPSGVSGDEFSQPVAPSKPGRRPSTGNGAVRGWRRAPKRLMSCDLRPRRPRTRPRLPAEDCVRCRPQKSRANKRPGISSQKQSPPDGAPLASPLEERSSESDPSFPYPNERRRGSLRTACRRS